MGLLEKLQAFKERTRTLFLGRYENLSNYIHTLSWLNIGIYLNLLFGVIFLCTGLILLTSGHEENQVTGWVFFAISLCMLLLGLFLLIVRCMFLRKSPPSIRHPPPRRRPRRPNQIYDSRPRSQPNMRAPSSSPMVWTTPQASDLESRTLVQFIAQMNFQNAQRSPVTEAPPSYQEATSNSSVVQTPVDNLPPPYQDTAAH